MPQPKGEFEVTYFGGPDNPAPCGGVNYSAPYTAIPPNDLAPGSVNTQNINGFLCSSPWVAGSPWSTVFASNEVVLGLFLLPVTLNADTYLGPLGYGYNQTLVVTNIGVYVALTLGTDAVQLTPVALSLVHTWTTSDVSDTVPMMPGQAVSFIAVNGIVYFTALFLGGIFFVEVFATGEVTFSQATNYVCGRFIGELAGRLVVAECAFPSNGGTGEIVLPTVAWSGVGIFGQAWDGNPSHDVWNPVNLNYFNGNIGGFNLLGDVPDQITGMGTVGQSIIIIRQNGITQQDPNSTFSSSGIQPFNWYHMWASPQGVGGYVGTVAQFGQSLTFRSDDNVYTLSLSSGLTAIGNKIIAKIIADQKRLGNLPGLSTYFYNVELGSFETETKSPSFWNFATMYNLDGQLHYLLTLSSYTTTPGAVPTAQNTTAYAYDLNMSDGSWHLWDFSQYYLESEAGAGFLGFSCPMVPQQTAIYVIGGPNATNIFGFFLFGGITTYGTTNLSTYPAGVLLQLVPNDYDFLSNPITTYVALLYPPVSIPSPTIVFRGETLTLGHKISTRRLRLQADNAPLPTVVANAQQQAVVTFTGAGRNSVKQSPALNMQGNGVPTGLVIQTYYGDAVLSDEMVQPSVVSVFSSATPWQTMCAFRIASASLIGNDATVSTQ